MFLVTAAGPLGTFSGPFRYSPLLCGAHAKSNLDLRPEGEPVSVLQYLYFGGGRSIRMASHRRGNPRLIEIYRWESANSQPVLVNRVMSVHEANDAVLALGAGPDTAFFFWQTAEPRRRRRRPAHAQRRKS